MSSNVPEHDTQTPPHHKLLENDRFQRIKEMIELPEEQVSMTFEPREADDRGLPLMLFLLIGIMLLTATVMTIIYFGVGNNWVNIILGNHFTK